MISNDHILNLILDDNILTFCARLSVNKTCTCNVVVVIVVERGRNLQLVPQLGNFR